MSTKREIRLIETDDGEWAAVDEDSGVTSTGETREEALSNLDAETSTSDDDAPLGDRLRGMAGDLDVDPVESVREIRERT
ncbi:type II toxin-antitoxin system HicB family antitoxin [Halobaculum sp. P14]|uniref:type II toxin-antitoxin system HicB family antitoxin n=1 Tax=Halobaculum sp. P14 TaxID=3421638 RepID=UPI003EBAAA71